MPSGAAPGNRLTTGSASPPPRQHSTSGTTTRIVRTAGHCPHHLHPVSRPPGSDVLLCACRGNVAGGAGDLLGVVAGSGLQGGGQPQEAFLSYGDGLQGARRGDGPLSEGQSAEFPGPHVHLGQHEFRNCPEAEVGITVLDIKPGQRVLEIGTGTGYSAALLAHRLGCENVVSMEIDPNTAEQARINLTKANYPVTVVTGDGVKGYQPGAPFDRIISTASVLAGQLPYVWVEQTVAGGMILTPWGTSFRNGELVSLVVQSDGTAIGMIVDAVAFMRLRSQRTPLGAARLGELIRFPLGRRVGHHSLPGRCHQQ